MNKGTAIALLIVGIVLLLFGIDAYHSASSGVSQAFTGTPTAKTICLLVVGIVATVAGAIRLVR